MFLVIFKKNTFSPNSNLFTLNNDKKKKKKKNNNNNYSR